MLEAQLRGVVNAQFEPVVDLLNQNLKVGAELGASLFIDIDGHTALDVWGGYRDSASTLPWRESTIANVWSASKAVVNMAALMLVAHGELNLDAPVANYWPEFAQNGKGQVLVRHILGHTSGVAGWDQPITAQDLYDSEKSTAMLAAQAPWWKPGTQSGYHVLTQGHLVGELIQRITDIPLEAFITEQLAVPLQADFKLGLRESARGRVAQMVPPPYAINFDDLAEDDVRRKVFTGPALDPSIANTEEWRGAVIGAANGHSNARSLGRILSTISLGGAVHGVRLLSERAIAQIFRRQSTGQDLVLDAQMNFGIGFGLPTPESAPFIPQGRVCYWGGWGGSLVVMDTERRMTIAFVMNKMGGGVVGSKTSASYVQAIYDCLGVPTAGRVRAASSLSLVDSDEMSEVA